VLVAKPLSEKKGKGVPINQRVAGDVADTLIKKKRRRKKKKRKGGEGVRGILEVRGIGTSHHRGGEMTTKGGKKKPQVFEGAFLLA